jgi:peptidoglycan/LPS O-acetylase OafA/YrhL
MRFLAALLVFAFHSSLPLPTIRIIQSDGMWHAYYLGASQAGAFGVTFFFVLSGFVLTWSARAGDTMPGFWRRRFVKIVPNYVLTWAISMAFFAAAVTPAWEAVANLFMLQSWWPNFGVNFSVDTPAWSLGVEAVFYTLFPVLLIGAKRIRSAHLKYWIVGILAAIVGTVALSYAALPTSPALPIPDLNGQVSTVQYWFAYVMPIPRVLDFALGILAARLVQSGRWRDIGMGRALLLLAVAYFFALHVPYLYGQVVMCVVPVTLLVAAGAVADVNGRTSWFRSRPLTWLGEISFAFYLLHWVVLSISREVLGSALFPDGISLLILAGQLAVTILASWAVYTWFEHPIVRRWSASRRQRRRPDATPAGTG